VTVEGEASYAHSHDMPVIQGNWTRGEQASFKWSTYIPLVEFVGKKFTVASAVPSTAVTAVAAKSQESIPSAKGPPLSSECSGSLATVASKGWLGGSPVPDLDPSTEDLGIRLIGDVNLTLPSCSGTLRGSDLVTLHGSDQQLGQGPFDAVFDLPNEAIDMDRIIQLLDGQKSGVECPGYETFTVACTLDWKATVTFVRTRQTTTEAAATEGVDESVFVPLPSQPPAPTPAPAPLIDEDLVVPLPSGKLDASGKQAKLSVTCSVACSGTASAYLPGHGASASAAKPLAKARFSGQPGRQTTVTLRFPARARAAVKRAGRVRVALHATALTGGEAISRNVTLRLPPPTR